MFFPFVKNDVVLIKLNVLGGVEICSPRKLFLMVQPLRLFLSTWMGKVCR